MFENEYQPMIENDCFYLLFKDYKGNLHKVEVTKEVFLQFFGVHKMINNQNQKKYFIVYHDALNVVEKEFKEKEYKEFQSFKSMQIKESNIYDCYIEYYELDDYSLHKRLKEKEQKDIVSELFHEMLINKLLKEISLLSPIQQRRLHLYYFEDFTMREIAEKEQCSVVSVKYSIDRAIQKLKENMK